MKRGRPWSAPLLRTAGLLPCEGKTQGGQREPDEAVVVGGSEGPNHRPSGGERRAGGESADGGAARKGLSFCTSTALSCSARESDSPSSSTGSDICVGSPVGAMRPPEQPRSGKYWGPSKLESCLPSPTGLPFAPPVLVTLRQLRRSKKLTRPVLLTIVRQPRKIVAGEACCFQSTDGCGSLSSQAGHFLCPCRLPHPRSTRRGLAYIDPFWSGGRRRWHPLRVC